MTTPTDLDAEEFLTVSRQAVRSSGGAAALDSLGWWGLLEQLDDRTLRFATFALFRAQGTELASTPALGGLLAQPFLELLGAEAGSVVAAVTRTSRGKGEVALVVDDVAGRQVLLDRPGVGLSLYDGDRLITRALDVPGRLRLAELDLDSPASTVDLAEADAAAARARSRALGRLALAAELLGAAEGAVNLAVAYAGARDQFGQPIGRFQAVRHLLAWAKTECVALESVVRQALWLGDEAATGYDEVVKALAGRNARRACERALQVFGGIGFTAEHDHHHFHSRVLLLDGLLGTSAELTHALGARVRDAGERPDFTARAVLASD